MPPKKRKVSDSEDEYDFDELNEDGTPNDPFVPGQLSEPSVGYLCALDLYSECPNFPCACPVRPAINCLSLRSYDQEKYDAGFYVVRTLFRH